MGLIDLFVYSVILCIHYPLRLTLTTFNAAKSVVALGVSLTKGVLNTIASVVTSVNTTVQGFVADTFNIVVFVQDRVINALNYVKHVALYPFNLLKKAKSDANNQYKANFYEHEHKYEKPLVLKSSPVSGFTFSTITNIKYGTEKAIDRVFNFITNLAVPTIILGENAFSSILNYTSAKLKSPEFKEQTGQKGRSLLDYGLGIIGGVILSIDRLVTTLHIPSKREFKAIIHNFTGGRASVLFNKLVGIALIPYKYTFFAGVFIFDKTILNIKRIVTSVLLKFEDSKMSNQIDHQTGDKKFTIKQSVYRLFLFSAYAVVVTLNLLIKGFESGATVIGKGARKSTSNDLQYNKTGMVQKDKPVVEDGEEYESKPNQETVLERFYLFLLQCTTSTSRALKRKINNTLETCYRLIINTSRIFLISFEYISTSIIIINSQILQLVENVWKNIRSVFGLPIEKSESKDSYVLVEFPFYVINRISYMTKRCTAELGKILNVSFDLIVYSVFLTVEIGTITLVYVLKAFGVEESKSEEIIRNIIYHPLNVIKGVFTNTSAHNRNKRHIESTPKPTTYIVSAKNYILSILSAIFNFTPSEKPHKFNQSGDRSSLIHYIEVTLQNAIAILKNIATKSMNTLKQFIYIENVVEDSKPSEPVTQYEKAFLKFQAAAFETEKQGLMQEISKIKEELKRNQHKNIVPDKDRGKCDKQIIDLQDQLNLIQLTYKEQKQKLLHDFDKERQKYKEEIMKLNHSLADKNQRHTTEPKKNYEETLNSPKRENQKDLANNYTEDDFEMKLQQLAYENERLQMELDFFETPEKEKLSWQLDSLRKIMTEKQELDRFSKKQQLEFNNEQREFQDKIRELQNLINDLQVVDELNKEHESNYSREINQLKAEKQNMLEEIKNLQNLLQHKQSIELLIKQREENYNNERSQIQKEKETLENIVQTLQKNLNEKQKNEELTKEQENNFNKIRTQLQREKQRLEEELDNLKTENLEMNYKKDDAEKVNKQQEILLSNEIQQLREQIQKLLAELEKLRKENQVILQDKNGMEEKLVRENVQLKQDYQKLEKEVATLKKIPQKKETRVGNKRTN